MNAFGLLAVTTVVGVYVLDVFPEHAVLGSCWVNFWRTAVTFLFLFPFFPTLSLYCSCHTSFSQLVLFTIVDLLYSLY